MASDEITWQIINQQFCAFKLNRYATVRSDPTTGALYLYIKTAERSHLPSQWWEKIRLPSNYAKALELVDSKLLYWPKFLVHKCKQRLTRLTQVAIRTRRLLKEEERLGEKIVPKLAPKIRRREETRERKAEAAAKVERAIERELIERLRSGAYGDRPLNVEEGVWKKVLRGLERAEKEKRGEVVEEEEEELEKEMEEEGVGEVEYVSDIDLDEEDEEDMEDFDDWLGGESADEEEEDEEVEEGSSEEESEASGDSSDGSELSESAAPGGKRKRQPPPQKPRKKPARVEIEYEIEQPQKETLLA
ncbi:MAG: hypothetical protein Q9160_000441 [Pyrenula sp. 1 TL-2023]